MWGANVKLSLGMLIESLGKKSKSITSMVLDSSVKMLPPEDGTPGLLRRDLIELLTSLILFCSEYSRNRDNSSAIVFEYL